jgi:hypothetical protein
MEQRRKLTHGQSRSAVTSMLMLVILPVAALDDKVLIFLGLTQLDNGACCRRIVVLPMVLYV